MTQLINKVRSRWFSAAPFKSTSNHTLAKLYLALALVFGTLIIYLSPFFTPPDENTHFLNMARISSFHIFPDVEDNVYGSIITADEADFINTYNGKYNGLDSEKITFKEMYFQSDSEFNGNEKVFYPGGIVKINPVGYVVSATGAWINKYVFNNFSPFNEMLVGKLFNLIFSSLMIYIAIMKTPILTKTMFLLALMPMTIYQCASLSYDAMLISSSFLLFAYATKLVISEDMVTKGDIAGIIISSFFIFGIKSAYIPLLIVLFSISRKKFGSTTRYLLCIGAIVAVGVVSYLIPTMIMESMTGNCANSVPSDILVQQREFVKNNPFSLVSVFFNTLGISFGFWLKSFFGILGSLDTNFWTPFIVIYYIILLITALTEVCIVDKLSFKFRLFAFISSAVMIFGTASAMYLDWTPLVTGEVGGAISTGTQGRYFIPVAIFIISVFCNPLLNRFVHMKKIEVIQFNIVKITSLCYLCITIVTLLTRFWI